MQEERNKSLGRPNLTLHINALNCVRKIGNQLYYLSSMLHLNLIIRTDLFMDWGFIVMQLFSLKLTPIIIL